MRFCCNFSPRFSGFSVKSVFVLQLSIKLVYEEATLPEHKSSDWDHELRSRIPFLSERCHKQSRDWTGSNPSIEVRSNSSDTDTSVRNDGPVQLELFSRLLGGFVKGYVFVLLNFTCRLYISWYCPIMLQFERDERPPALPSCRKSSSKLSLYRKIACLELHIIVKSHFSGSNGVHQMKLVHAAETSVRSHTRSDLRKIFMHFFGTSWSSRKFMIGFSPRNFEMHVGLTILSRSALSCHGPIRCIFLVISYPRTKPVVSKLCSVWLMPGSRRQKELITDNLWRSGLCGSDCERFNSCEEACCCIYLL